MRELIVGTREIQGEGGARCRCTYSVLIDEMDVGRFSCESYGVRVREELSGREAVVPHVTVSIPRIDELMDRLVEGGVTPWGLRDVIDDWL